ncbi:uncharacterized protein LOC117314705 [Pecten maximus]|uniref:uncharacterized protein LOC117314705 n=1 Tax=Pecten maximus TaxID=6579 RepID=UPI001458E479|nr:uncharacterized protein LOC117314705 [Pecten maximus]XP_033724685.1 uncharacterized protein LOC117314705 [Pecten maximus]
MEESIASELDTSQKVLSDFRKGYTTVQMPGKCSYLESVLDVNNSNSSTIIVSVESPQSVMKSPCINLNTSALSQNMSSSPKDNIHNMGAPLPSLSPVKELKENTTEPLESDPVFSVQSPRPYPRREENQVLSCFGADKKAADISYRTEQNICVAEDNAGDIFGQGPVIVLESTGRCFSCGRQCTNREERFNADETSTGSSMKCCNTSTNKYSDGISEGSFGDQSNEDIANDCNNMPSHNELVVKQVLIKDEQTREHCLNSSSCDIQGTKKDCINQSTNFFAKTNGNTGDDDDRFRSGETEEQINENRESQGHDEKNYNCQNRKVNIDVHLFDESQTESLLSKTSPDSALNSDSRYAEALARREEMVKDLGVDGSGLRVMCCMLAIILVFAIVIIIIAVVGL